MFVQVQYLWILHFDKKLYFESSKKQQFLRFEVSPGKSGKYLGKRQKFAIRCPRDSIPYHELLRQSYRLYKLPPQSFIDDPLFIPNQRDTVMTTNSFTENSDFGELSSQVKGYVHAPPQEDDWYNLSVMLSHAIREEEQRRTYSPDRNINANFVTPLLVTTGNYEQLLLIANNRQ